MSKVVLLLTTMAMALLLASAVALVVPEERAKAAFPGKNAKIVFERDPDGWRGPKDSEIYSVWFDGNNLQRLTNNATRDTEPAWSADGKRIVFSGGDRRAWDSYRADLFVMRANGSDKTRVTDEAKIPGAQTADDLQPAFSPSGRQIVFVRNGPLADGHTLSNNDIYKIGTDGKGLTRLVNIPSLEYYDGCCPAWSPDGSKIAFYSEVESDYSIETIRPNSTDRTFINYGFMPSWFPDGSQIVYARGDEIYKMNANGTGTEQELTTNDAYLPYLPFSDFTLSPSGTRIVFSSNRDGDYDLYVMDTDGSDVRRLTNRPGDESSPDWQPAQ